MMACSSGEDDAEAAADMGSDYGNPEILSYCSSTKAELASHEIRRIYDEAHMDHFVSSSEYEWSIVEVLGYQLESLSCWVP